MIPTPCQGLINIVYIIDALNKVVDGLRTVMASNYGTTLGINMGMDFSDFPALIASIEEYMAGDASPLEEDDWVPGINQTKMRTALEGVVCDFRTIRDAEILKRVIGRRAYCDAMNDLKNKAINTLGDLTAAMDDFRARCLGCIVNWHVILECSKHFADACSPNDEPESKATTTE